MAVDVIVIGGDVSGLAAATALAERAYRVKVYEAGPHLATGEPPGTDRAPGPHTRSLARRLGLPLDGAAWRSLQIGPPASQYVEERRGQVRTNAPAQVLTDGGVRVHARDKDHRVKAILCTTPAPLNETATAALAAGGATAPPPSGQPWTVVEPLPGLFVLADWTRSDAAATMEAAIGRGHDAADALDRHLRS